MRRSIERGSLRSHANDVEEGHRAGRGRCCAERLQLVSRCRSGQADDRGDVSAHLESEPRAEHRIEDVSRLELRRYV